MSLIQIDPLGWLPDSLKQQIIDTVVTFVADQAEKVLGGEVSQALRRLRSDAGFQQAVDRGLKEATDRFVREYMVEDEDLVVAIARDPDFWKAESVRQALLEIVRHPGVYLAEERTSLAQSFADVLRHRVNRERVDCAVTFYLRCVAESLWHLEPLRPIYELQMQRLSVERATEMVQEMRGMRTDVRRAMVALVQAVGEQQELLTVPDKLALPQPRKVYHNLPQPDYGTFIGREEELRQVHRLLSPQSRHFLVTIDGIGGIGKSALALEVTHRYLRDHDRLPPEERFEAIIWTSAKSSVLTADGIAPRQQVTRTLEDIYTTISIVLEREDITRARPEEQDELVRQALARQRTLLIVDNLETLDDERVNAFLRELPAPTKAIVTTRHRIDVAYPMRLMGMPEEDGLALIAQECVKRDMRLTKAGAQKLYDRTGGVPLAIVWSVAQMGYGYGVDAVLRRLGKPTSDIAHFCFEGALARIRGKSSHELLMALSLFATDASREALGYVTDLPELDRDDGLVELERLSLMNRRGARFDMLPLTKSYSIYEAENVSDFVIKTQSRLRDYFVRLVQQSGGPGFWDTSYNWAYFAKVGEDLENMLSALDWTWEHKDWTNTLVLARGVIHLLHARGRLEERILRARQALHAAKQVGAVEDLVWFYVDGLGYVELQRGDYKAAQRAFSTGLTIAESTGNVAGIALAQSRLALLGIATQEDEETRRWITAALSRIKRTEGRVRTSIHHTAGHWFRLQKQYAQAERHYREAFLLQRDIGLDVASSLYYRLLGLIRYDQGQYKEAEEAFKRCLDLEQQIHNALNIANAKYGLALVAEAEGDNDKATAFVLDAVDVYSRFGAKKELDDAEMLLKRLQCVR